MVNVYFDNIENIIKDTLSLAKSSVEVCVAWINFDTYGPIFKQLLYNGLSINIIINNDSINNRYTNIINELQRDGAIINRISMPTNRKYMHHKFCIIDDKLVVSGSFNWTTNANQNNFENLFKTDDIGVILKFKTEFNYICSLSTNDIRMLQTLTKCPRCKKPIINIFILSKSGDSDTEVAIYELCEGCGANYIKNVYFDASLYNDLYEILDMYSDTIEENYLNGMHEENEVLENIIDYKVNNYLSSIKSSIIHPFIIHSIGVYNYDSDGDRYIKILWKQKFVSRIIENFYYF